VTGQANGSAAPEPVAEQERVVTFRPRTVLIVIGVLLAVAATLGFVLLAQQGLTIIAIALFLSIALNPAVEYFQGHGLSRSMAVATVTLLAVIVFALLALVFIPPLVTQISRFITALPDLTNDLTKGRGPLGFLERRYHIVEEVRKATTRQGPGGLTGAATPALGIAKSVATLVGESFIIAFLTLFMLLEGPEWRERLTGLIPQRHRGPTERIAAGVYRSVIGFVTGNLLASILAGVVATILLLIVQVPYAFPLGLFTAIVELVPYIGPAIVTVLLSLVALATGPVTAGVVLAVMVVYHLIEGHTLRPLIYGRALRLSALAVLIAIILGTEVAGILGALAAIPIAGSVQVVISEILEYRKTAQSS
jgi:predicted PurR-regulated permease PerM